MNKRLAPKNKLSLDYISEPVESQDEEKTSLLTEKFTDIFISDYTPKSFIVMGSTISHANNLGKLGGKHTEVGKLGLQWFFAGYRKESVKKYIETGTVEPAKWSGDTNKFEKKIPVPDKTELTVLFKELKEAFEKDAEYTGESILQVIDLIKEKYC